MALFGLTSQVIAQSELACKVISLHMETQGSPPEVSKAVLQVIRNRMRIDKQTACQVVKRKGAFPWSRKKHNWKFTHGMLTRYFTCLKMEPVVGINTYYFNDEPVRYGTFHAKIGQLYFNDKEK